MTYITGAALRFSGAQRAARGVVTLAASLTLAACGMFDTDINNPNAVVEESLSDPAAAKPLVNGLGATVSRSINQIAGTIGAVSDELTWAGSREAWNLLDGGDINDPVNEYTDGQYPYLSEARWLGDYSVTQLEKLNTENKLRDRVDLARAYTYSGLAYLLIAENYEDFVVSSDRQANGDPVGEANILTMFDKAVSLFDKGVTLSTTLNNAEWRRNATGLRARAKFSKAVRAKFGTARQRPAASNALVNDAGASADALAALSVMPSGYRMRFTASAQNNGGYFATGFEISQRLEIRAGDEYVNTNTARTRPLDGIAGIKLVDPVTGQPDAVLARAIDECCRQTSSQFIPTTLTSEVEMQLILAEAALAANNMTEFNTRINAVRSVNGLAPYAGTPAAQAVLIHARRTNLYLQGRRLMDHYRFNTPDPRWLPVQTTFRKTCFFPISYNERLQNPKAPQPAVNRSAACS
jgi:hypothetical protein